MVVPPRVFRAKPITLILGKTSTGRGVYQSGVKLMMLLGRAGTSTGRPGERRDPYSVSYRFDKGREPSCLITNAGGYGSRRSPGRLAFFSSPTKRGEWTTYHPAKNSSTISQNFCGACSNIGCVVLGIITVFEFGTCAASVCSTCGSAPLVLAPPMNSVGVLIASASALENGGRPCPAWRSHP